ncbi:MAG: 3-methyladenine glycosylase [Bradyrhizobium sp.]|jgi:DNA-3-methyladenine glycosylase|nr:3-methyladenine glycosylase [Bradyrhizobium sp.]
MSDLADNLASPLEAESQPLALFARDLWHIGFAQRLSPPKPPILMAPSRPLDNPAAAKMGRPLKRAFFGRSVHVVAPDLIGATLLVDGIGGIIVEVEAYHHTDPAAHSFRGPTPRNRVMFGPPGFAYVYRSYGIHWCVNFVCEEEGSASAILIRALEPTHGIPAMRRRRRMRDERSLCSGPGKLTEALAITDADNGLPLDAPPIALYARKGKPEIVAGVRIGITKAVELPWRYGLKGSKFFSKPF